MAKALVVALAAAASAVPVPPALATHVGCGDTVTRDTTLDSDLLDCPGNAVRIVGDSVTLDLGGHVIDGTGRGLGILAVRTSRTVVRGGRVAEFHDAIVLDGATAPVLRDVAVTDSHDGILVIGGEGALVDRVVASGHDASGINLPGARGAVVRDSTMVRNAAGVSAAGQTEGRFERNLIGWNLFHGMRFSALADTVLDRNRLPGNGTYGIRLEDGSAANTLTRNHVVGSGGDGISLAEDSGANALERNHADRNGGLGFDAPLGVAVDLLNKARRNGDPRQCVGVDCAQP